MRVVLVLFLFIAGCNTAGPGFRGTEAVSLSFGADRFLARRSGALVEVIRMNPRALPTFPPVAVNAAHAVYAASGCLPVWVVGDPSMMVIGLACAGETPPKRPKGRKGLVCEFDNAFLRNATGTLEGYLECAKA